MQYKVSSLIIFAIASALLALGITALIVHLSFRYAPSVFFLSPYFHLILGYALGILLLRCVRRLQTANPTPVVLCYGICYGIGWFVFELFVRTHLH